MSSLISEHNSDGCVGRCDAKCYNATSMASECDCICNGMNHGAGINKALDNTREYADRWIEQFKERRSMLEIKSVLNPEVMQLTLFH